MKMKNVLFLHSRIYRRALAFLVVAILSASSLVRSPLREARAQVRPVYSVGAIGLGHLLRRLQTTASVMHTGAHPDDEDSALIARLARGDAARVAYLSLNRGEGGQNIIGTELLEPLGVIRTEELLQARRLDGGEQLFTRTFDYGFTKTRAEAATKWGEQLVLADIVRAIRLYRPLVIISRFTGTPADGHGQHQLAGYLTPVAFRAADDPNQFPEQIREGLRPWQARKLYVSEGFRPSADNKPTLRLNTGSYDPLYGRSYFEIAMEGRSQHKSQEMGVLELRGEHASGVRLMAAAENIPATGTERGVFDGIDTSITGISRIANVRNAALDGELSTIQKAAQTSLANYDSFNPQKIVPALVEGLRAARRARETLGSGAAGDQGSRADADFLLAQKEREFTEALQRATGAAVDVVADTETVAPGESFIVTVRFFAPENTSAKILSGGNEQVLRLRAPEGWRVEPTGAPPAVRSPFRFNEVAQQTAYFRVMVPENAPVTEPYWLHSERDGYVFKWATDYACSLPFAPPLLNGEAALSVNDTPIVLTQQAQYRYADDIRGELRRDVNVVPALSVGINPDLIVVPTATSNTTRRVAVRLINNSQRPSSGKVSLRLPAGWTSSPNEAAFDLKTKDERTALIFNLNVPANTRADGYAIEAVATTSDGRTFDREMRAIAYPHIQTHRIYAPSSAQVRVLDLRVAPVSVGYVMGSGDDVPDAIRAMGLGVTMLDEEELTTGDLSKFDVIVVGVRASQVRSDFVANNNRLLDYVRRGGTMIVQYQRPDYVERNLAPFPAKMAARVTNENAPVRVLRPAHPAFNFPNRITDADWQGWVQERSLYNFTTYDPQYVPLLESHDEGEPEQTGGEVYAQIGQGTYVYTSYAWFRQLPSGVAGAYRLFANLLSLPKAPAAVDVPPQRGRSRVQG